MPAIIMVTGQSSAMQAHHVIAQLATSCACHALVPTHDIKPCSDAIRPPYAGAAALGLHACKWQCWRLVARTESRLHVREHQREAPCQLRREARQQVGRQLRGGLRARVRQRHLHGQALAA